tara:strand:+ start:49 stop:309 length:261 start_codon:yes stop_codon:yes gene_type:complete
MNPTWLLKRVAELEKKLVLEERLVTSYQIIVNETSMKGASKEHQKFLKENNISMHKRLKKLVAKDELLKKVPELEIAYRDCWKNYE